MTDWIVEQMAEDTAKKFNPPIYRGDGRLDSDYHFQQTKLAIRSAISQALEKAAQPLSEIHGIATEMWRRGPVTKDSLQEQMEKIVGISAEAISQMPLRSLADPAKKG